MSITPNNTLTLTKSGDLDLTALASGGLLPASFSKQFYVRAIESAKILPMATGRQMGSWSENLPAIKFDGWVLSPGEEGAALGTGDTHVPTFTQPVLSAKTWKGKVPITREALKDNVQGGTLLQLIMDSLPQAVGRDMDRLIVRGDTSSTDARLKVMDGLIKQAITYVYAGGSVKINKDQLEGMINLLPNEYKEDTSKLVFFTSIQAERCWQNAVADRMTILGDAAYAKKQPAEYSGIPIVGASAFLNNIGAANTTNVILTDPKNIVVGLWQDIELRIVEEPLAGKYWVLCYLRFDVKYQDESAVAKATYVKVA